MNDKRLPIPVMLAAFAVFAGPVVLILTHNFIAWIRSRNDGRRLSK